MKSKVSEYYLVVLLKILTLWELLENILQDGFRRLHFHAVAGRKVYSSALWQTSPLGFSFACLTKHLQKLHLLDTQAKALTCSLSFILTLTFIFWIYSWLWLIFEYVFSIFKVSDMCVLTVGVRKRTNWEKEDFSVI